MFKKKLTDDSFTNLISEGTRIHGDIIFNGILKVEGEINADINCESKEISNANSFITTSTSKISGNVLSSPNAIIGGVCNTLSIYVTGTLRILKTAVINNANINYDILEIETGAILNNCQMIHSKSEDLCEQPE